MNFNLVFWLLLLSVNLFAESKLDFFFQHDVFIRKNQCGDVQVYYPNALRLETDLPTPELTKNLEINFAEKYSQFNQRIIYNGKTFYYPKLFGPNGHHEYEMPNCVAMLKKCRLGFFVFDLGALFPLKIWDISIQISRQENSASVFQEKNISVRNDFHTNAGKYLFGDLDLKVNKKTNSVVAYVNQEKIKSILQEGFEVEFVFSWRNSLKQISYSDETERIQLHHEWLSRRSREFPMKKKSVEPFTYLSFMVHVSRKNLAFESKIVVLDKTDSTDFFQRCE